ncbi:MAG: 3-oxoacyl-[acyl-carrier-protein] reductase [Phycisphaerales bacterium]|nr:3-oxoacyl-[acyl-carrier-protein] reductase [Phycisphaerales bacterium]
MSEDRRVAIVTGASRGIGRSIAKQLATDGFLVVAVARNADALNELVSEVQSAGGHAEGRPCDLMDDAAVDGLIEGVVEGHGRLDVLVNNAGVTRDGLVLRMSDDDFDTVIATNLRAVFRLCRAVARPMMRQRWGRIINIGSVVGMMGNPGQANYAAAKAGLIGMTRSIGKELGGKGITANVVAPGWIDTDMTAALPEAMLKEATARLPLRRLGQSQDIADGVSFLASDRASYITGHVLTIDGGMLS